MSPCPLAAKALVVSQAGFDIGGQTHPIVPILLGDAQLAGDMAAKLLKHGVFVVRILRWQAPCLTCLGCIVYSMSCCNHSILEMSAR